MQVGRRNAEGARLHVKGARRQQRKQETQSCAAGKVEKLGQSRKAEVDKKGKVEKTVNDELKRIVESLRSENSVLKPGMC